ncbi:MAG: phage tail protein [Croceibacterium sp.]
MKSARRLAKTSAKTSAKTKPSARKAKSAGRKAVRKRSTVRAPGPTPAAVPVLGQVALFAFGFAPVGWLQCDGRLMAISQNTALFSLLATTYGGNGVTNFALPDLRPAGSQGPGYFIAIQGSYPAR